MKGIKDTKKELPRLKDNEERYVYLQGSHFQQNNVIIPNNSNVSNIYVVYKLELCKLLKMLILQNMTIKDMVYVLMKVNNLLTYEKKAILIILHWLET